MRKRQQTIACQEIFYDNIVNNKISLRQVWLIQNFKLPPKCKCLCLSCDKLLTSLNSRQWLLQLSDDTNTKKTLFKPEEFTDFVNYYYDFFNS